MAKASTKKQPEWAETQFGNPPANEAAPPAAAKPENITLDKLSIWKDNVRKTGADENIAELEASILSHGLINPLFVMKSGDELTVVCGNRRLKAIQNLAARGALPADHSVPCQVVDNSIDAKELSTAENVVRQKMHPLDEAEAFRYLTEKGQSLAQIGQRFGVTEAIVKKRLALADVSPVVKEALAAGQINLAAAQAFSVGDDHKRQEKLLQEAVKGAEVREDGTLDIDESDLRGALTDKKIAATDRRVRFVTVEAYKAAGGKVTLDLFTEGEDGIYIEDSKLLDDLVRAKLDDIRAEFKAAGWGTVKAKAQEISYSEFYEYEQRPHSNKKLSEADDIDLKAWKKELASLPRDHWKRNTAQNTQAEALEQKISALQEKAKEWPEKTMQEGVVLIGLERNGTVDIRRGLVPKKSAKEKAKAKKAGKTPAGKKPAKKEEKGLPVDTLKKLSVHRSSAISAELLQNADVALAVLAYGISLDALYSSIESNLTCIEPNTMTPYRSVMSKKGSIKGLTVLQEEDEVWKKKMPKKAEDLWDWIIKQSRKEIDSLLVYLTALQVDDMDQFGKRHPHADKLADVLKLDMTKYYTPTADNLFGHMGKPQLLIAIKEIRGAVTTPAEEKMGKDQLAKLAEKEAAAKKWLPAPLQFAAAADEKKAVKKK